MSYVYLLNLYQRIDAKIVDAERSLENAEDDPFEKKFHTGRIEILMALKNYLDLNLTPKMPRGLKKRFLHHQTPLNRAGSNISSPGGGPIGNNSP